MTTSRSDSRLAPGLRAPLSSQSPRGMKAQKHRFRKDLEATCPALQPGWEPSAGLVGLISLAMPSLANSSANSPSLPSWDLALWISDLPLRDPEEAQPYFSHLLEEGRQPASPHPGLNRHHLFHSSLQRMLSTPFSVLPAVCPHWHQNAAPRTDWNTRDVAPPPAAVIAILLPVATGFPVYRLLPGKESVGMCIRGLSWACKTYSSTVCVCSVSKPGLPCVQNM